LLFPVGELAFVDAEGAEEVGGLIVRAAGLGEEAAAGVDGGVDEGVEVAVD